MRAISRLMIGMTLALLSACASVEPPPPAIVAKAQPSLAALLTEAEQAQKAGQNEQAATLLHSASLAYPNEKMPWLKLAQLRFETGSYGEAILAAQQTLERDPDDTVAISVVAVSGLRLASKALADLTQKNHLNGSVRSESQELAKLLRDSLGAATLVKPAPIKTLKTPLGGN